jgi:hypothetical protein
LRKAWKYYNKLHSEISALHKKVLARSASSEKLSQSNESESSSQRSDNSLPRSETSGSIDQVAACGEMTEETSARSVPHSSEEL